MMATVDPLSSPSEASALSESPSASAGRSGDSPPSTSVTVVIAAYQAESTLDAALASVLGQTTPPSKVVVVDDGSTDATSEVADRWTSRLPLQVLHQTNEGAASASHLGIMASDTELIALLDADDVWMPDHLETLIRTRNGMPDAIACALGMRWIPGSDMWRGRPAPLPLPAHQLEGILLDNFGCGAALFPKKLYEQAGGFRGGFPIGYDWDLWIRMIRAGGAIVRPSHTTFLYRMSSSSLTQGARDFTGAEAVLVAAEREARSEEEIRWARAGLARQPTTKRRIRAANALVDAYEAARSGSTAEAREKARQSLSGTRSVATRGLAVMVWPQAAVAVRDRLNRR